MKIDKLQLINFKCLSDVTFQFGNLNILAGANDDFPQPLAPARIFKFPN